MSDQFTLDVVQAAEFKYACERNGLTNADIKAMSSGNFLAEVREVIRGNAVIRPVDPLNVPKPAQPLYLVDTGNRYASPVCEQFDMEAWIKGLPIYDQGSNFRSLVKGRIEKNVPAGQLRQFRNTRGGNGAEIVKEIKEVHGGKYTCFADIKTFIESEAAKKDGTWYVFMMEIAGVEWLVDFDWCDGVSRQGWDFSADHPGDYDFRTDRQFLFRDSAA